VNGGLGKALGDGYIAAAFSFCSGLLIMGVIMLCSSRARQGLRRVLVEVRAGRLPWWVFFGGACGAFFVLSQSIAASVLGLALFTVGVVAGQVFGGLVIDRIGIGPSGRIDPTSQRVTGTVLAVAAVVVSVLADLNGTGPGLLIIIVPMVAGFATSWQSAVNGLIRAAARSAVTSTFVNFVIGAAVLLVALGISISVRGWPEAWPSEPWFYVGGAIGTFFIAITAILVRTAGVLLLSMSNVAGQLIAAVALEAGLPLAGGVTPWMLGGAAVALLAVVIAVLPGRWRARATRLRDPARR